MTSIGHARTQALPLEGIRILELGMVFVLPLAIMPLAALGADVIKVEAAERPDSVRWGPVPDNVARPSAHNHGGHYQMLNRNKRGITLDLSMPEGRDILLRLVAVSDVVAENFTPRVLENLKLTYDDLRAVNPSIILLSSTGFGQSGPWRNYRSYGPNTEAVDGLMHLTGYPDGPPVRAGAGGMGVAFTDASGAFFGTFAILAALERRQRTGEGAWLDLSHYEAGVATIPEAILDYSMNGRVRGRQANRDPRRAPQGCYPCAGNDRWVAISVASDAEFAAMAELLDQPNLARDPRFATLAGRQEHQEVLDAVISEWTAARTAENIETLFQEAGVEATVVATARDVWLDGQLHHRQFFELVPPAETAPEMGPRPHIRAAWKMSGTPTQTRTRAPDFGQHTREVLGELLGLNDEDCVTLARLGVIADEPASGRLPHPGPMDLDALVASGRLQEVDPHYREVLRTRLTVSLNVVHHAGTQDELRPASEGGAK